MGQRAPEIVDEIGAAHGTDVVEDGPRLGEGSASSVDRRPSPSDQRQKARQGPPVPPRTLGAPTISVAPAAGSMRRAPRGTRSRSGPPAARRSGWRNPPRPVVERQRVDRHRDGGRLLQQHLRRLDVKAREMQPARARRIGAAEIGGADLAAQPEFIATQAPSGIGPFAAIQAVRSSGVSWVSRSSAARARISTTQSGTGQDRRPAIRDRLRHRPRNAAARRYACRYVR
jgi:hypothetical protein